MSQREEKIVCRRCKETFPLASGNCPHCGSQIRNKLYLYAGFAVGFAIVAASLTNIWEFWGFALFGLVILVATGYFIYDRRERRREAMSDDDEPEEQDEDSEEDTEAETDDAQEAREAVAEG